MAAVHALFHVLFFGADGTWPLISGPLVGAFAVLALIAVGAALVWTVVRGTGAWPLPDREAGRRGAMRRRSERAIAVPVRAPDTPGKPRPRAPGAAPVAATT